MTLAGRTVALAEGRQLEELAQMLEKEGATPLRCPLVSILDAPDEKPVLAWLNDLIAGRFALVILLTGEGLRRLTACGERHGLRERMAAALAAARIVTRGPKPVRALKELYNLSPAVIARTPTTDGVIESLRTEALQGATVGVQLYSASNPPLVEFLQGAGATVHAVQPYVYAAAADADRVADLLARMSEGSVDAIVFTSSPQIDRLWEVAEERGLGEILQAGLARTKVAAVGPVIVETLQKHGVHTDIVPEQGFVMKNLVQLLKRTL